MSIDLDAAQRLLPYLVALPVLGALINATIGSRLSRGLIAFVGCGSVVAAFILAWLTFNAFLAHGSVDALMFGPIAWLETGALQVDWALQFDALSSVFVLIILGIGGLIHIFSYGYMHHEPALARYYACLNFFIAMMLLLVLGDSLPVMFVGWEGVGLASYVLIGFWYTSEKNASAGQKAFIVNRIGDVGFLLAMFVLHRAQGSLDFLVLSQDAHSQQISQLTAEAACLLLALGATGKSAQIPLYVWLPQAMAGPTPVSALMHAATMVTAGIYMGVRLNFLFALAPTCLLVVACVGAATALWAAILATCQTDIKRVLAYSTISQLGYMFMAVGMGAFVPAIFHVTTHAFFKACLFLGAGAVIHALGGEQDVRNMGGLAKRMPLTCATFLLATFALAGVPPLSGFVSKDAIIGHALSLGRLVGLDVGTTAHGTHPLAGTTGDVLALVGLVTAFITAFYMGRLVMLVFFGGRPRHPQARKAMEPPLSMLVPLIVLAMLSVGGGALGWPHVLGGHMRLWAFLAPVLDNQLALGPMEQTVEIACLLASSGLACLGLLLAFFRYGGRGSIAMHAEDGSARLSLSARTLLEGAREGGFVDALYATWFVRPLRVVSQTLLHDGIEVGLVQNSRKALVATVRNLTFVVQLLHNGNVQRYIAIFGLGLLAMMSGWWVKAAAWTF